ncbi:protein tyrosine phosphatase [Obelidium mucronatum]|nr:protein tyrosine phosphatase [Obelidium mucronatum]
MADNVPKKEPKGDGIVQKYLLIYNAASAGAWAYVAFKVVTNARSYATTYSEIGDYVLVVQTAALLEIFHSLFKLVRSPVTTTLMQVASRLTLVWLVADQFKTINSSWAYSTMTFAWSVSEIIRYGYYALNLMGSDSDYFWFLTFCRYHFFYVLYPLGAYSEYVLLQKAHAIAKENPAQSQLTTVFNICLWIWPPCFYIMYSHMQKQRAKFIKSGVLEAKEAKETGASVKKNE